MNEVLTAEKIVADGQALARWNEKAVFVAGLLPGETATVKLTQKRKTSARGDIVEITTPSTHRGAALEAHWLSCSPWQAVDYAYQIELKTAMLTEAFGRPELALTPTALVGSPATAGYRNKLEFSIETDPYGELNLAFHERGSFIELVGAPDGCILGTPAMNAAAIAVLNDLRKMNLADYPDTLTVRQSQAGEIIVVVTLRANITRDWTVLDASNQLAGVGVVRQAGHRTYRTVWSRGNLELSDTVGGVDLTYPWDSFFQVNVPAFEHALTELLAAIPDGSKVIDLYGGAGTIGLAACKKAESVLGVEVVTSSVELARRNAKLAGITNYKAIVSSSEDVDKLHLAGADVIIVDPPRAGLHPDVVDSVLQAAPATIIYLSCNPVTQVRDLILFKNGGYQVGAPTGYDFYPGTLHLESLVILTKA